MQLLVLALMLMLAGKNTDMNQIKPILESFAEDGGAADVLKKAEELSGVINAVQSVMNVPPPCGQPHCDPHKQSENAEDCRGTGYPLAPVANIADERITYCLSKYIALGE